MARFLRVTTKDRLILQGLLHEPSISSDKIILHIHGMAGNFYENRFLDEMADVFTKNGWSFLCVNTRGHDMIADFPLAGKTEEYKRIGNYREIFEECVYDISAWMDLIREMGFKEVVLQGHSLGAVKAVYYLGKTNDVMVTKLILASPPDMIDITEKWEHNKEIMDLSKKMIEEGKGDDILPRLIDDWYYLSAKTYVDFGERGNPIDVFNIYDKEKPSILNKITIPILAFLGSDDIAATIPVTEALSILKSKAIKCPQFDTTIVDGAPHSYFGHEKEVAEMINDWLIKKS